MTLLLSAGLSLGTTYSTTGGATWLTLPGSAPSVVPMRQPASGPIGGDSAGVLQSATAVLYAFPAAITYVFVNPMLDTRITVGLANGDLWRSLDAGLTWILLWSFGPKILQVLETFDCDQTYVAADGNVWVSHQANFKDVPSVWTSFSLAKKVLATQFVLGTDGNYAGGSDGTVLNVDTGVVLAGPTSPVLGLAYNPRHSTLWVLEQSGQFWRMKPTETVLTNLSTLQSGGPLTAVSSFPGMILAATPQGMFLSPDAGVSWQLMVAGVASSAGVYNPAVPGGI